MRSPLLWVSVAVAATSSFFATATASIPWDATFVNPVIHDDAPDPGAAYDAVTKRWWVAVTGGDLTAAFALRSSPDLVTWKDEGHVFTGADVPKWAKGDFWAPELHLVNGTWTVYFAATHFSDFICIGVGKSAKGVAGPYWDALGVPLISEPTINSIDPTFFHDVTGKSYIIWKRDGNSQGKPTPIFINTLDESGTKVTSGETQLITNTLAWEGAVTEAPWMILVNGTYYLFYSGNAYNTAAYAIGVAVAEHPTGPFTKIEDPIAHTDPTQRFYGPGHCSVVWTGRNWALVYAAWNKDGTGRNVLLDALVWKQGIPSLSGDVPSVGPVPIP